MDETLTFFAQLMTMTQTMLEDIIPDLLLNLDQKMIVRLMLGAEKVDSSLQMFIKLCQAITQNMPCADLLPKQCLLGNMNMLANEVEQNKFDVKKSQPCRGTKSGDNQSAAMNLSDFKVNCDEEREEENGDREKEAIWKGLLADARNWYLSHDLKQIPQMYYCGVCNKKAKAKHVWEAHLGGKSHLKLLEDVFAVHSICDRCSLNVYGDCQIISVITSSNEHRAFDAVIKDNRQISATHSTVAGCFGKSTVEETKNPDSSANSGKSHKEPIIPALCTESTNSILVFQDPKPVAQNLLKVSKVIFQGTAIHADFVNLTDKIAGYIDKHESFKIAYCRPCEIICESEALWVSHKSTPQHKGKMRSKYHKNVLCRCVQCEFIVTAGAKIAVKYMRYHIERGHLQSTEGINNDEYMEVRDMFLKTKIQNMQPKSEASSFKGSKETVYSDYSCALGSQNYLDFLPSSSPDLRVNVAPSTSKSGASTSVPAASSRHWLDVESVRSSKAGLQSSSEESLSFSDSHSSSSDLRNYLDRKRASRAVSDASAPDPLPRRPIEVGHKTANQGADMMASASAASCSRPTEAVKKTSTNPYRSGITMSQVSDQDAPSAQIPPASAITPLSQPSAQNPDPAQSFAPLAQKATLSSDLEFTFLKMLSRKEESFQKDTRFKLFTALCLECKSADFSSLNSWTHHLKSHKSANSIGEVPCLQCNSRFYGDVGDIYNSIVNHDYHVCIDAMFSW